MFYFSIENPQLPKFFAYFKFVCLFSYFSHFAPFLHISMQSAMLGFYFVLVGFVTVTWMGSSRKLGELGNLENLGNFFPRFLNPSFRFWLYGKIENSEIRKLGIIFPRFPRFPTFPSFGFATFSFSFIIFFSFFINVFSSSLFYICNYSSTLARLSH